MTDGFLWGGINIRKLCRYILGHFWMVIAITIITHLGLDYVDKKTYTPSFTSTAIAAVYPTSSSYRYHTLETIWDVSSKTEDISAMINSDLFQSGFLNQNPSLQDCAIGSSYIENTDLVVLYATSGNPENAFRGIWAALDYYSQFSGKMAGAPEIKVIHGPVAPYPEDGGSRIHNYRLRLSILSGLMMAGLLVLMYISRKTYKTEHSIKKRYDGIRFFSLPFIETGQEHKKGILSKSKRQDPITRLALEIRQVLHKFNKKTLLITFCTEKAEGSAILSALAGELAKQDEKVILIGTESLQFGGTPAIDSSDDKEKNTLSDILQRKCTAKDAMLYSDKLKSYYIQSSSDRFDKSISHSIDDVRRVLSDCLEHADIVLVNGAAWYPFHDSKVWQEAVDATVAVCRQDDDFYAVDKLFNNLQKADTYFAGCVLFGF